MSELKLYCFALYCEGNGQTKSQVFASYQYNKEQAIINAQNKNLSDFPINQGWGNHQFSMIEVPKDVILNIYKSYETEMA